MTLKHIMMELDPAIDGPPVFDVDVPALAPGQPGRVIYAFPNAKRSSVVSKEQVVHVTTILVIACNPQLPVERRRFALMGTNGEMPDELAIAASAPLYTFRDPRNGMPVTVYEFPAEEFLPEEPKPDVDKQFDTTDAVDTDRPGIFGKIDRVNAILAQETHDAKP